MVNYHLKVILLLTLILNTLGFISCNHNAQNKTHISKEISNPTDDTLTFNTGILNEKVKCMADTTQSYALYLPADYSRKMSWPIIYFFDSHASGSLPLKKYKDIAEQYGFILAASNVSKNGQSNEFYQYIIEKFINDVSNRFSIDKNKIYSAGFSGGARVAVMAALAHVEINTVIGCGAGFPNSTNQAHFHFMGIVGDEDFNYTELKRLDKILAEKGINHQLLIYPGKHEWPPLKIMEQAFNWLECNAMRDGYSAFDQKLIENIKQSIDDELLNAEKEKDIAEVFFISQKAISYLQELDDISTYESKVNVLKISGQLQEILNKEYEVEKTEYLLQQQYTKAFSSPNRAWWDRELDRINKMIKSGKDAEDVIIYKRLLAYLSLMAYMHSTRALDSDQLTDGIFFLKIYEKVDPENSEHAYLYAQLYMKQNNSKEALKYLNKASQMGFDDENRLLHDSQFTALKQQSEFGDILIKIKSNQIKPL
jgi:dienelactone hydrolase